MLSCVSHSTRHSEAHPINTTEDTGVEFSQSKANEGWTTKLEHKMRSSGRPGVGGCSTIGGQCSPFSDWDCERYYDETNKTGFGRNSYWVFQAVIGLHSKIDKINEEITRQTLVENLKISQTLSEFDAPDTKASSVFKWIAAAASMGGGLMPLPGAAVPVCSDATFSSITKSHHSSFTDFSPMDRALPDS